MYGSADFDCVALTLDGKEYGLTEQDFGVYDEQADDTCLAEQTDDTVGFEEIKTKYGLTISSTTYSDDALGTIYGVSIPNTNGIGYEKTIDARGFETVFTTDENTSRVTKMVNRTGTITNYAYDAAGNLTYICECDEAADNITSATTVYDCFNNPTSVTRGDGMQYLYGYNAFHRLESIRVAGKSQALATYSYKSRNGRLKRIRYANGSEVQMTYNRFGQVIRQVYTDAAGNVAQDARLTYDFNGNPIRVLDITAQKAYTYVYENGVLTDEIQSNEVCATDSLNDSGTPVCRTHYSYDNKGWLVKRTLYDGTDMANKSEYRYAYTESGDATVTLPTGARARARRDALGRFAFDEIATSETAMSRRFEYCDGAIPELYTLTGKVLSSPTTSLVKRIAYSDNNELTYEYDGEERITKVTGTSQLNEVGPGVGNGWFTAEYTYDCHGQLIRERRTDYSGSVTTTDVTYDGGGNIRTKGGKQYLYDSTWKDLLVSYDGKSISYDAAGNPTSYLGDAMTWTADRKLRSICTDRGGEDVCLTYTYNALGQRVKKTEGSTETTFEYEGSRLVKERTGANETEYLYDANDSPIGMRRGNTVYYYKKNLQGDIIELLDESGKTIAEYVYDAWGKLLRIRGETLLDELTAMLNPFRYRGYYHDNETGFYYLQSRYYDPEVGRFLNSDEVAYLGVSGTVLGYNLFAYCENNPVNYFDPVGEASIAIPAFVGCYGTGLSGAALIAKLTAFATMIFPYLVWGIAIIVAAAVTAYIAYSVYLHSTKVRSDVKLKLPPFQERVYQLAYANNKGEIIRLWGKMTYNEAVIVLSGSAAVNTLMINHKGYWGIYTNSQAYAKALAAAFGGKSKPEVHGDGYYAHYHDDSHKFHVWYGGKIRY